MTTLPPPATKFFPDDSLEKKIYNIVENLSDYLPIVNDRNRLAFSLYKFMQGEGDHPNILIKSTKIKIEGITPEELAAKILQEIESIKSGD
jgi:DNA polymerase III epsilon subunit-like protein